MSGEHDIMQELQAELEEKKRLIEEEKKKKELLLREKKKTLKIFVTSPTLNWDLAFHFSKLSKPFVKTMIEKYGLSPKLSRQEVTETIKDCILSPDLLKKQILYLEENIRNFFIELTQVKFLPVTDPRFYCIRPLLSLGLVHLCDSREGIVVLVSQQVNEVYQGIKDAISSEELARIKLLYQYGCASIHLYGCISFIELVEIFNQQNEASTTLEEMTECLDRMVDVVAEGYVENEWYKAEYLVMEESEFLELLQQQEGLPRYIPRKDEFLKNADSDYMRPTLESKAMKAFLSKHISPEEVEPLLLELHKQFQYEMPTDMVFDVLARYHCIPEQIQDVREMTKLIFNMDKYTKKWRYKGYSLGDQEESSSPQPFFPRQDIPHTSTTPSNKVSKNASCPCGSGKKYKRCCGNA